MDLAGDEAYARELAGLLTRHLTAVGVESLRLGGERLSGIWIYDDIGANAGPMVSPRTFERVFLPLMAEMVSAYKEAGADFVVFHSDGNILPLVDMLVRRGTHPAHRARRTDTRFGSAGRLALIGGWQISPCLADGRPSPLAQAGTGGGEGGRADPGHTRWADIAVRPTCTG